MERESPLRRTGPIDHIREFVSNEFMKLTVRIRLMPNAEQAASLRAMTQRFNAAAEWIAEELFTRNLSNKVEAQRLLYREVRERFGLSAQTAILCIHRACEAYKRDPSIRPQFRQDAGITYDVRTMSFKGIDKVGLLTLFGRIVVPMVVTAYQAQRLGYPRGQCDLIRQKDGKWYPAGHGGCPRWLADRSDRLHWGRSGDRQPRH